jgi:uncharacterized membrane protein YagU involved in acid resistance
MKVELVYSEKYTNVLGLRKEINKWLKETFLEIKTNSSILNHFHFFVVAISYCLSSEIMSKVGT